MADQTVPSHRNVITSLTSRAPRTFVSSILMIAFLVVARFRPHVIGLPFDSTAEMGLYGLGHWYLLMAIPVAGFAISVIGLILRVGEMKENGDGR